MSINYLVEFTEHAYGRVAGALDGITEEELRWRPVPEMNTAGKVLRHIARISLASYPGSSRGGRRATGTPTTRGGSTAWPRCSGV